jgi:hypothetical protein
MIKAAYIILAFGFIYLGVRLFNKFREIASWKSEDELEDRSMPSELRELKIEEPGDEPGSLDGTDENKSEQN